MKYGKALRIARLALTVAVIAILVIPLVATMADTNVKQMSVGIESKYELSEFDNSNDDVCKQIISLNLERINDTVGYVYVDGVKQSVTSLNDARDKIFAAVKDDKDIAVVHNSDDKVCIQESIQYHDDYETTVVTGMKLPDNIGGLVSFDVSLAFVGSDYSIPYGSSTTDNGYLLIRTEIPDLLNLICNSQDHDMEFKVHVTMFGVASFDVDIDVFTKAAIKCDTDSHDYSFNPAVVGKTGTISVDNSTVTYGIESGKVHIRWTGTESLADVFEAARNPNGTITLDSGAYTIKAEYVNDLIRAIQHLEEEASA